jgi:aminopeptidase N
MLMKRAVYLFYSVLILILFRSEGAIAQDKGYDAKMLDADVRLDKTANTIDGYVIMHGIAKPGLTKILQHAKGLTIDSVFVNGIRSSVEWTDTSSGTYHVTGFGNAITDSSFRLSTYYHGIGTTEGGAMHWGGVQNNGEMMYAMGVGFHAPYISCTRHWLPCYDLPDDKLDTAYLGFEYVNTETIVSNGVPVFAMSSSHSNIVGRVFKVSHPIATYLLTFALGEFVTARSTDTTFPPRHIHCYQEDSAKAQLLLDKKITPALRYFESIFSPYPFEKVGYVVAPTGSMEHQTMITLVKAALDTNSTVAIHELAHMWWGGWVTCKDFNDPWLNEGFATFSESLFLEHFKGRAAYISRQKSNISAAISSGSTIPLYGTPLTTKPSLNFPYSLFYQKGASVLGMLRYFIGDEKFFAAVRSYGQAHAYGSATSFDLQNDFETSVGQDLNWFFKKWVFGIGYPTIKANWSRNGGNVTMYFEQTQNAQTIGYFRLPFVIEARTKTGDTARQVVWMDSTQFSQGYFTVPFTPDTVIIDPEGQVIKKITGQVRLGVDDATPTEWKYPTYQLIVTPNPSSTNELSVKFFREPFMHDALGPPSNYDPYYWMFEMNQDRNIEYLVYDSLGDKKATLFPTSSDSKMRTSALTNVNLASGSYTLIAKLGSQILAQGRFTVAK